ncbi:hypothetical protein HBH98_214100 [Parastagonospora nodorum]|nr:hypothetical protein HBH98_214100 [Parastagonospora nodorum]KAH4361008.1 hypothetical protein HBH97_201690 [Parastagonospora nodorum]KAH4376966.1 hypothetical protein HBH99_209450 [Parastagonospora nodorum]KAH6360059.1 hypothetical protein HBI34_202670 [Parastagonospora nodorum]
MSSYRNASSTSWVVQVLNGHHRPETHEHCHHHINRARLCSPIDFVACVDSLTGSSIASINVGTFCQCMYRTQRHIFHHIIAQLVSPMVTSSDEPTNTTTRMAVSDSRRGRAGQLPIIDEKREVSGKPYTRVPRRKITLITITILLNILHWSSLICVFTSIYQIAATPDDKTSIPSEVLTLLSAFVTISYTYLHTIISFKSRTWTDLRKHRTAIKQTSYIATRIAVTLCVLWLLTSGWNMIIVARRPVCLPVAPDLQAWEMGTVCQVARLGIALVVVSLVASCILFGVLAVVRRPFEAHLFKHGYERPTNPFTTPSASRGPSPVRPSARTLEKQPNGRRPTMLSRSRSNSDIETIDLSHSPGPPTIHCPSPQRSVGLGIFTSEFAPPPIPPQFRLPLRSTSLDSLRPLYPPSSSQRILTRPPRLSGNPKNSIFIPLSVAPQYSASTLRALYPTGPPKLYASQSHPHLPSAVLSHRSRFSQSSVSLSKPHRLNTVTHNDGSSSPSESLRADCLAASALAEDALIPSPLRPKARGKNHKRTSSAPDVAPGAQEPPPPQKDMPALRWKSQLPNKIEERSSEQNAPDVASASIKLNKVVRSSSAEFMSRFSPDSSPDSDETTPRQQLERNFDLRARVMKELPFRRSRSAGASTHPDVSAGAQRSSIVEAAAAMVSNMPQDLMMPKTRLMHSEPKKNGAWDDWRNKPLPRIAHL